MSEQCESAPVYSQSFSIYQKRTPIFSLPSSEEVPSCHFHWITSLNINRTGMILRGAKIEKKGNVCNNFRFISFLQV
jgi:hypothetical protein